MWRAMAARSAGVPGRVAVARRSATSAGPQLAGDQPAPRRQREQPRVGHADAEVVDRCAGRRARRPSRRAAPRRPRPERRAPAGARRRARATSPSDERARADPAVEEALGGEPLVGHRHGVARHLEPPRQLAGGRQALARRAAGRRGRRPGAAGRCAADRSPRPSSLTWTSMRALSHWSSGFVILDLTWDQWAPLSCPSVRLAMSPSPPEHRTGAPRVPDRHPDAAGPRPEPALKPARSRAGRHQGRPKHHRPGPKAVRIGPKRVRSRSEAGPKPCRDRRRSRAGAMPDRR